METWGLQPWHIVYTDLKPFSQQQKPMFGGRGFA